MYFVGYTEYYLSSNYVHQPCYYRALVAKTLVSKLLYSVESSQFSKFCLFSFFLLMNFITFDFVPFADFDKSDI